MSNERPKAPPASDTGGVQFDGPPAPEVIPVELPYLIATLLPDGNLDIRLEGEIPVDKMFTIGALATRIANQRLDDEADADARRKSLILRHGGNGKRH